MNFAHPSVEKQKQIRPNYTISDNGLIKSDKNINIPMKSSESQNAAIAGYDVSLNGTHTVDLAKINQSLIKTPAESLRDVVQFTGCCQTIPYLHAIQSQLDWTMDYESLWQCIPDDFTGNPIIDLETILNALGKADRGGGAKSYRKLYNLLYNPTKCFSVREIPKNCSNDVTEEVGDPKKNSSGCDDPCRRSIRIRTKKVWGPTNEKELCDRLNKFGPVSLAMNGTTAFKLQLLKTNLNYSWDDIKDMDSSSITEILTLNRIRIETTGGHAVTITSCENGVFKIKNSWPRSKDFSISWADIQKYFELSDMTNPLRVTNLVIEVTECPSISNSPECLESKCEQAGFDGTKQDPATEECDCYCDSVTVPTYAGNTYSRCKNSGETIQKIYSAFEDDEIRKKGCACPEHPEPQYYSYIGKDCCVLPNTGSWCEKKLCEKTKKYYYTGNQNYGNSDEYKALGEEAADWWHDPINSYPRPTPCLKEEICSGADSQSFIVDPSIMSKFNIVSAKHISVI